MIDFWEVLERCSSGQRMKESDYDTPARVQPGGSAAKDLYI